MVMVKDLTKITLKDLWQEVKGGEDDWWEGFKAEALSGYTEIVIVTVLLRKGQIRAAG